MATFHLVLNDCFVGVDRAYIYILYSKSHRVAYVGETNDARGVIGRLNAHIGPDGTLRVRLMEKRGVELNEVSDLCLFAYRLPAEPEYVSIEKAYRRGVEYLVQFELRQICGELRPYLHILSNVNCNDASSLRSIQSIASEITASFASTYSSM